MGRRYDDETVELGLTVLALAGDNTEKAAKHLRSQGTRIASTTLRNWRQKHSERYTEIRETRAKAIEGSIIAKARDIAIAAADLELDLMAEVKRKLDLGELRDPAGSLRNVTVTKGVNIDKSLVLDGRPDTIVGHQRTSEEIWRELAADGIVTITDANGQKIDYVEPRTADVVPLLPRQAQSG